MNACLGPRSMTGQPLLPSACLRSERPPVMEGGRRRFVFGVMAWCLVASATFAGPRPAPHVTITDRPNDAGTGLIVTWELSPDDDPAITENRVVEYRVFRQTNGVFEEEPFAVVPAGVTTLTDTSCARDKTYSYRVLAVDADQQISPSTAAATPLQPVVQWFDRRRLWVGVILVLVCGAVIISTELAKRGMSTYIRPIAGLTAIDEAVGRATEMGRPMLFVPGIMDLDQIETIAGLTVMAHVGEKAAAYDTPMDVPTTRTLVMTAAKEALAGAYLTAGRPENFDEDRVYYVTEDQFGYVASVCGWMSREKPAACFYLGKFYAESLLLAETGNAVGAIQLAGTAEPAQLPFFVAACDYTLIGEELFAASAYLSGEPQQLGTLKGQDVGKLLAGCLLVVGCLLTTCADLSAEGSRLRAAHTYLVEVVLNKGGG